jgi:hypothetical protein
MFHRNAAPLLLAVVTACGGSSSDGVGGPPPDLTGKYSLSLTNSNNGCNYTNFKVGDTAQNIELDMTQSGASAAASLRGLANVYFALLGIGTLQGSVNGASASLSAVGTTSIKQGQCAYFVRATADVTLTGNTINGTVTYTNETNKSPDCGALETCSSQQSIAGSRAPK